MSGQQEFILRTEDLRPEEVLGLFVPIRRDRELVEKLKSTSPIIIEGARGTGKSLLLRVCEQEQLRAFGTDRILPVYVSFSRSSLLNSSDPLQFQHWMLALLCSRILRALSKAGLNVAPTSAVRVLSGGEVEKPGADTKLQILAREFERSYKRPGENIDAEGVPSIERFKEAIEDICATVRIRRFNILFDEAAHIFRPEQQRQFFDSIPGFALALHDVQCGCVPRVSRLTAILRNCSRCSN